MGPRQVVVERRRIRLARAACLLGNRVSPRGLEAIQAPRTTITMRLDADVLARLKAEGPGYQSRINAILRAYLAQRTAHHA